MTIINVNTQAGRLDSEHRRILARTLTDAVLVPEIGQLAPAARPGFQVLFNERPADACGMSAPSPAWWVNFRVIDDGSWGSRGTVLSILDLLDAGVSTPERAQAVRDAVGANR
jgi:hypothetical protein